MAAVVASFFFHRKKGIARFLFPLFFFPRGRVSIQGTRQFFPFWGQFFPVSPFPPAVYGIASFPLGAVLGDTACCGFSPPYASKPFPPFFFPRRYCDCFLAYKSIFARFFFPPFPFLPPGGDIRPAFPNLNGRTDPPHTFLDRLEPLFFFPACE